LFLVNVHGIKTLSPEVYLEVKSKLLDTFSCNNTILYVTLLLAPVVKPFPEIVITLVPGYKYS
jgi:hypothetical protein